MSYFVSQRGGSGKGMTIKLSEFFPSNVKSKHTIKLLYSTYDTHNPSEPSPFLCPQWFGSPLLASTWLPELFLPEPTTPLPKGGGGVSIKVYHEGHGSGKG